MAKWPQTSRDDVAPETWSNPKKKKGESFNTAFNLPNNPTKNKQPTSFNVTDDYCHMPGEGSEDDY